MSFLIVGPTLVLWAAVIARARRLADPSRRDLWWALLCCAVASTLNMPVVAAAVDVEAAPANVSQMLKHVFVVAAAWLSYEVVRGLTKDLPQARKGRAARRSLAALVVLLLVALFVLSPADRQVANFTAAYGDEPVIGAYWMVFLGALGVALASVGRLAWWYRHKTAPGGLRTGMSLVTVGVAAGLIYVALKVLYVAARLSGTPEQALAGSERTVTPVLLALSIVGIVTGVMWPALIERWPLRQVHAAYQYARLRRLWVEVTTAAPEVSLERTLSDEATTGASRRFTRRHEAELLLFRRLVEILDGLLVLDQYVPPAQETAVRRQVARDVPARMRSSVEERALLELAMDARATGAAPASPRQCRASGDLTPMQEVHRLRAVDAARRAARPVVATVRAERVDSSTGHSTT
ncbi:MAB_1171c family putative transporter [Aquipuribacter nitratireducens]|uniref:MAB_1171c family putative transporter n=1 Tax=Aquipuribacter nitratireducens TaxID=650104 RepID=A0ABW0GT95_9MICO